MWCLLDGGVQRRNQESSVNDNCRCCCLLKILFRELKHFHAKSFSRPLSVKDFRKLLEIGRLEIESLLGKRPSCFSLTGNCLRLFLACVWHVQLTLSQYLWRIFRCDNAFNNAFSIIFCLRAEDLHCNQRCLSYHVSWSWPFRDALTF